MTKPAHITRMEEELAELCDRGNKLAAFIAHSELYQKLSAIDQSLLVAQAAAMASYEQILAIRVSRAANA